MYALGADLDDVVKTYTFLVDEMAPEDFEAFCSVHRTSFPGSNRPTGTMVYVPRLALEGALVQVDAVAYTGPASGGPSPGGLIGLL